MYLNMNLFFNLFKLTIMEQKKKLVKITLGGKDENLFERLRSKLIDAIDQFLDTAIDYQSGSTIKDETKKFASLALNFAEEKLRKAGIENHKLIAEIEERYSIAEKNKAEARKVNAEANKIEFDQSIKKLTLSLKLSKAIILGEEGKEAIVLTKQIDLFLGALEEMKENNKLLE